MCQNLESWMTLRNIISEFFQPESVSEFRYYHQLITSWSKLHQEMICGGPPISKCIVDKSKWQLRYCEHEYKHCPLGSHCECLCLCISTLSLSVSLFFSFFFGSISFFLIVFLLAGLSFLCVTFSAVLKQEERKVSI